MKYVLFYDSSAERLAKAPEHFTEHRARWKAFVDRGELLMIGPFADPREGAMAVFTTREAAEEFATGDPFVVNGVVAAWRVSEWNEALT